MRKKFNNYILMCLFLLAQICLAQDNDNLMLYRTDFKNNIIIKHTESITTYKKNNLHFVYAGGWDGIDVFKLNNKGKLTPVSGHEIKIPIRTGSSKSLVATNVNGIDFLFAANKNNNAIETFKILDNGSLEQVSTIKDTDKTHLGFVIALKVIKMGNTSYLFAGGLSDTPGLSSFKIESDGSLTHIYSIKDNDSLHLDGVVDMDIHKIKGITYLYTSGFHDNGVSGFKIHKDGTFENINNLDDNSTDRFLDGVYSVKGITLGSNHYIVTGHRHHVYYPDKYVKKKDFVYHGDGISVFKVTNKGVIVPHFVLKDNEKTKLKGQTDIAIVSSNNNEAIIAVASRDEVSIQLCKLNKEGVLTPINYLETGFTIYSGLDAHTIGESNFVIAGSNRFDLKKLVAYKLSPKIDREGTILKHTVNFIYKKNATQVQIKESVKAFKNLKNTISALKDIELEVKENNNGELNNNIYSFILTFNDEHARETYLFNKAHWKFVNKVKSIIKGVTVADQWIKNN